MTKILSRHMSPSNFFQFHNQCMCICVFWAGVSYSFIPFFSLLLFLLTVQSCWLISSFIQDLYPWTFKSSSFLKQYCWNLPQLFQTHVTDINCMVPQVRHEASELLFYYNSNDLMSLIFTTGRKPKPAKSVLPSYL